MQNDTVWSVPTLKASKIHESFSEQEHIERVTRVRACNYIKIEAGQNILSVLKIVTRTAQAV